MNQIYYNGDFWQCVTATNPGETPDSTPAKWRRIQIPKEWRRLLAKLTYANLLELDGQTDKAAEHRTAGESMLEDVVREAAAQEKDRHSGSVRVPQGQSVAASVIIEDAERLMRWDLDDLEDSEKQDARTAFSQALQQVWEAWWWPSLMEVTKESLRPAYASDAFYSSDIDSGFATLAVEVYLPATEKYYRAVQPVIRIAPATLENGAYVTNTQFWTELKDCYSGPDVDNTLSYAYGTVVRNPSDGLFYQRSGSILVSGTAAPEANGVYKSAPDIFNAFPLWTLGNQPNTLDGIYFGEVTGNPWFLLVQDSNRNEIAVYEQTDGLPAPDSPDQVKSWGVFPGHPGNLSGPTTSTLFVAPAPPDPGSWGLLVPFDHVLTYARTVRSVSRHHPQQFPCAPTFRIEPVAGGVRVPDWHCGTAWVWSRRVTPVVTGDDFDPTTTYEATPQDELVFDA